MRQHVGRDGEHIYPEATAEVTISVVICAYTDARRELLDNSINAVPRPHATGAGVFSRYPIVRSSRDDAYALGLLTLTVRPPGSASDVTVLNVHLAGPYPQPIDRWRQEIAALRSTMNEESNGTGRQAVIVAGDFNASLDMRSFRKILRDGFTQAREHSGAGLLPTFPADRMWPPLVGIDHILTLNAATTDVRTERIPGTDHLGLRATVHVPA